MGALQDAADVKNGLALGNSSFELADDLLGNESGSFHGGVPGPVWPNQDSHSLWTDSEGARHCRCDVTTTRQDNLLTFCV